MSGEAFRARIATLHMLLRAIEWAGDPVHYQCPCCNRDRQHGHEKTCELQRALVDTDPEARWMQIADSPLDDPARRT